MPLLDYDLDPCMAKITFGFENPLRARLGEAFFKRLPKDAGVYTFFDGRGLPLYIGKADNLRRRLMSYQAAKPGQVSEHILEMIEHAEEIRFETHASGSAALRREGELIRSIKPPYNIALTWETAYLYVGFRGVERRERESYADVRDIEFRLSNVPIEKSFESFGCFRHRGKVKGGYSALLRLIFAAHCPRDRFLIPARLCRSSPAYTFVVKRLPHEILEPLESFLAGRDTVLLSMLFQRLMSRDALPKPLYLPLQRDFQIAKEFFAFGPQDTRRLAARAGIKAGRIDQERMDRWVARDFSKNFAAPRQTSSGR